MTDTVIDGMDEAEYHAHTALSCSASKLLLPPSCPAKFRHAQLHGSGHKPTFDLGHAAHTLVLGIGADIAVIDADDWRTKAAKDARDTAYAEGQTPLLAADWVIVQAMADAIRQHPITGALFNPERGKAEQSLFWTDAATGVDLRSRLDWITTAGTGRTLVVDLKTTVSSEPGSFGKSCASFGYAQQAAWYLEAVDACGISDDAAFLFAAIEKTAPYVVTVFELDTDALRLGADLNRYAREVYRDCLAADSWPGYSTDVTRISLPAWFGYQTTSVLENAA